MLYSYTGNDLTNPMVIEGAVMSYDGYGLRTLNISYLVNNAETAPSFDTSTLPQMGEEVLPDSRLFVSKISKTYEKNRKIRVSIEAIGMVESNAIQTNPCVDGACTTSGDAIETHPDFSTKIGGTWDNRFNGAVFDAQKKFVGFSTDTTGTTVTSPDQPLAGIRTFLSPRNVYRGHFHARADSSVMSLIRSIGCTTDSGYFFDFKFVPEVYQGAGMLMTSCNIETLCVDKTGYPKIVKVSYELTGGGPRGWNKLIYKSTSAGTGT